MASTQYVSGYQLTYVHDMNAMYLQLIYCSHTDKVQGTYVCVIVYLNKQICNQIWKMPACIYTIESSSLTTKY